jgi:hypothetical protein
VGYSCVTTVLSPAASQLLTDLPTTKVELSIATADTSNDAWLTQAITQVSASIQRHTKRVFAPEYVQDVFDVEQDPYPYQTPGGFAQLELSRWPVLAVTSVVQTLAPGTTQALVQGTDFRVDNRTGRILRLNPFTGVATLWEAIPVTVTYTAGFGALELETHSAPAVSPFEVTVDEADDFSCDQGVSYANGTALVSAAANPAQGQYVVDDGVYTFNAADASQSLAFAYATLNIPADIVEVCLKLITARFRGRARDPLLIQRDQPGLGTERFWFDTSQTGAFPPDIEDALDDYRVPTVA